MKYIPNFQDVLEAAQRIEPHMHRTPVLTSRTLNRMTGAELFLKSENLQRVGAFKARGACNAVFSLTEEDVQRGVATHSSGNHGAALAYAAGLRGIPVIVVMPDNAPLVKRAAVAGYGAEIVTSGSHPLDRELALEEVIKETGATFVHPSNDPRVIAGQGTAALELLEDVPDLDVVMAPVGGGGLLSGTALAVSGRSPATRTIAAEPEMADDAYRSFRDGVIYPSENPQTIADGLRTFLGDLTFPIIREHVADIVTVSEQGIIDAMRVVWERTKSIIEPSSAVPVAALLEEKFDCSGLRIGIIISGGNVDLDHLPWHRV
ncbi:MAG: pyridoxal-phosphate dependent enzyme [Chloroflexi bacterium]|nr:pyridoxal-phosphate dependent enzyme [Chloroflexota bacterium]